MLRYSGCANCGKMESFLRCNGFQVTNYCSPQHKHTDYAKHKPSCDRIKKALTRMQARERAIRAREDNAFAGDVGWFWGCPETRPYMRARFEYGNALWANKSVESVQTQLDLAMESLILSKIDNMGIRHIVPSLMISLDKDQECYDFVKGWAMAHIMMERWSAGPIQNSNPLESTDWCEKIHGSVLAHTVSLTLLKIKLMFVLIIQLGDGNDNRALDIEAMVSVEGSSFMKNKDVTNCLDKPAEIEKLKGHIRQLYAIVDKTNPYFWPALVKPRKHLGIVPEMFGIGGKSHMQWTLTYTYDSWKNCKPAIDIIGKALKGEMI